MRPGPGYLVRNTPDAAFELHQDPSAESRAALSIRSRILPSLISVELLDPAGTCQNPHLRPPFRQSLLACALRFQLAQLMRNLCFMLMKAPVASLTI